MELANNPAFVAALEATVIAVNSLAKVEDGDEKVLPTLRAHLFNEHEFNKSWRNEALARLNKVLATNYTMSQIRKADPTLLNEAVAASKAAKAAVQNSQLVEVTELNGSVEFGAAGAMNNSDAGDLQDDEPKHLLSHFTADEKAAFEVFAERVFEKTIMFGDEQARADLYSLFLDKQPGDVSEIFKQISDDYSDKDLDSIFLGFLGLADEEVRTDFENFLTEVIENKAAPAAPAVEQTTTHVPTQATSENTNMNTEQTRAPKNTTDSHATTAAAFILDMVTLGFETPKARDDLYNAFLEAHPSFKEIASVAASEHKKDNNDQKFVEFLNTSPAIEKAFREFATKFSIQVASVITPEERSRFSFTGEDDQAVRSGWVAVAASLVGAGLEAVRTGNITIGSGIGALAGTTGAFFAAEYVDKHVDSTMVRYGASAAIGAALGTIGASVGRIVEGKVFGDANNEPTVVYNLPMSTTPAMIAAPASGNGASNMLGALDGWI